MSDEAAGWCETAKSEGAYRGGGSGDSGGGLLGSGVEDSFVSSLELVVQLHSHDVAVAASSRGGAQTPSDMRSAQNDVTRRGRGAPRSWIGVWACAAGSQGGDMGPRMAASASRRGRGGGWRALFRRTADAPAGPNRGHTRAESERKPPAMPPASRAFAMARAKRFVTNNGAAVLRFAFGCCALLLRETADFGGFMSKAFRKT